MTETLVRDPKVDGHWFVYVDGFHIGDLFADQIEGWPTSYHYTIDFYVSNGYSSLAEAEVALVQAHKTNSLT
jgi:hypothetical protein